MSHDKDEWGNIELPGLSDEKLFGTNWNRVAAGLENKNNEKLLALAESKKGDEVFSEKMKVAAEKRNQTTEYQQNHKIGVTQKRKNTYQVISNNDPSVKKKISNALTGKKKTDEHKRNLKKVKTNKPGDSNWEQACQQGRNKRDRPFKCPFGVFNNRSEAARYAKEHNLFTNAQRKLEGWTKEKPDEYYFITHEKYNELKSKTNK